jgi:hypothetical protein
MNILPPKADAAPPGFAERFGGLVVVSLLAVLALGVFAYGDARSFDRLVAKAERVLGL